ncbi:molybdenum ABC transporter ATP-binding protein [Aliishimia ponticola]|uniref:Molybdenum ABC transporter ATP-binding protein n=1 Tax=Aliishimia ponticola TaxID=2499833 RepID=A0A4S4NFA6_9RHOB|nr:molybdenum ABC transporter ATP-binding protein [Aliishimia ponticola]THH37267.1 molybdenum ABC transporter ATP-binding protein [Aliishimia ponticola]
MQFDLRLRHALPDLTLDIALQGGPGVTALFGPSGAGKTSIINAVAGLFRPDHGRMTLGDRVLFDDRVWLPPERRRMGYVFQDGRLFPHLTVRENLRFGAPYSADAPPLDEDTLIDLLALAPLLNRRPRTLSGGETQRVALARALLCAPQMLLMDEPLAALDGPRKEDILPYLDRVKSQAGIPILYVTHAVDEIARLADHVALLQNGRITLHGPVFDVLSDPAAMPLLGVREAGAILHAVVADHGADGLTRLSVGGQFMELPGVDAAPGEQLRLRILARDVILSRTRPEGLSARNILYTTIDALQTGRGPGTAVVLQLEGQRLLARVTDRSVADLALAPGQAVYAIVKSTSVARSAMMRLGQD